MPAQAIQGMTFEDAQQTVNEFNETFYDTEYKAVTMKGKDGWYMVVGRRPSP